MSLVHPLMMTSEFDHSVTIDRDKNVVLRWERDRIVGEVKARRTVADLYGFTPVWDLVDANAHTWKYDYIVGREATAGDIPNILNWLHHLRSVSDVKSRAMTLSERYHYWYERPMSRLRHAIMSDDIDFMKDVAKCLEQAVYIPQIKCQWHGDMTLSNVIIAENNSIWLIDHAVGSVGPELYDAAKLYRGLVLTDEGEVDENGWREIPHYLQIFVFAHIVAMTGRHTGVMRERALNACCTFLQCQSKSAK